MDLFHAALNRVVDDAEKRIAAHGITRTGPAKVSGRHLSQAPNSPQFNAIEAETQSVSRAIVAERHAIKRESTGHGLGDSTRLVCSCGWSGTPVYEYQDDMSTQLRRQEVAHLAVQIEDDMQGDA